MRTKRFLISLSLAAVLSLTVAGVAHAAGSPWWAPATATVSSSAATALTPLSDAEKNALLLMREEEKLARDVYTALYATWKVPVFNNIAASETRHMASVKTLLYRYGLTDPVAVDTPGVFVNTELQTLYTQLVAQGRLSLKDAYRVGVTIETLDIEDLKALLATSTAHRDVTKVAQNLLQGSQSHLTAFNRLLAK